MGSFLIIYIASVALICTVVGAEIYFYGRLRDEVYQKSDKPRSSLTSLSQIYREHKCLSPESALRERFDVSFVASIILGLVLFALGLFW